MTDAEAADRVLVWIRATLPELSAGYTFLVDQKGALPDVLVEITSTSVELGGTEFPFSQIQQTFVTVWRLTASIMVDDGNPGVADTLLKDFATRLRSAAVKDGTLGGRVPFVSPMLTFDYANPYVEYADGTRGREMTVDMAVGELVEAS